MINSGYSINIEDHSKFNNLRQSEAYALYLKSVASSPIFKLIIKEHAKNIDVSLDVKRMVEEGVLPENISVSLINEIFKKSINRMAVNLIADSLILKEMEELKIDKIKQDLENDAEVTYLLGMADESYYKEAEKLREKGEIGRDDLAFRGLLAFNKRKDILEKKGKYIEDKEITRTPTKILKKSKSETLNINLDSSSIII